MSEHFFNLASLICFYVKWTDAMYSSLGFPRCGGLDRKGSFYRYNHVIYYSGNERGGSHGVAFIVNKSLNKCVLGYNPVSDRIITIRLQVIPVNVSVVQVYAPTSTASDEDMEGFYNQLQDVLDSLPKTDFTLVVGTSMPKLVVV